MTADARRKIFDRAADLVKQGWCQEVDVIDDEAGPRYCLFKALRQARREIDKTQPLKQLADPIILAIKPKPANVMICEWNDAPGRTQAEVVAVLRAVAGGE